MRVRERHAPRDQPIDVRRFGLRMTSQMSCPVIQVIDGDEQYIRPLFRIARDLLSMQLRAEVEC